MRDKLYTAKQVAGKYGVSRQQVVMDLRLGKLKGEKVGGGWIVREKDLKNYRKQK